MVPRWIATGVLVTFAALASVLAPHAGAIAGDGQQLPRASRFTLLHVDGDAVVFGTSGSQWTGAKGTSETEHGVVRHDGYATFGAPVLLDHYEVRLVASAGIEEIRPYVLDAAGAATAVGGQSLAVRRGLVAPGEPARGQIDVVVSSSSPCRGRWLACAGPNSDDDGTIDSGRIWVSPRLLGRPAHEIANTVRHELGHTLGLAHYEFLHHDRVQTMHPSRFDAAVYEAGDINGIRALSGSSRTPRVQVDGVDHDSGHLRISGQLSDVPSDALLLIEIDETTVRRPVEDERFEHRVASPPGTHLVCVSLEWADHVSSRNCRSGTVPGAPVGLLESVTVTPLGVVVSGWASEPRSAEPVTVVVDVDGEMIEIRAAEPRADGTANGFTVVDGVEPGAHTVCAHVTDMGGGPGVDLGCRVVLVSDHTFARLGLQTL